MLSLMLMAQYLCSRKPISDKKMKALMVIAACLLLSQVLQAMERLYDRARGNVEE